MADVYVKLKRDGIPANNTGNLIITDDAGGLLADINDNTSIKFDENGAAYIDLSDGKEPAPLSDNIKDAVTERRVYNALPQINGSKEYDADTNIIVPTETGKEGQVPTMRGGKLVFEDTQDSHTHDNKNTLDAITNKGNGDKFLSDNGTYKEIEIPESLKADDITIKIKDDKLIAIGLDGLETEIAKLNFIKNLDKDIMEYIRAIGNPMKFKGVVESDGELATITTQNAGDMYIVRVSASNDNKKMSFVSNGTTFEPIAETEIQVRDFLIDPIDLTSEATGVLSASHIDETIARKSDIPGVEDIEKAVHDHSNKSILDNIINTGEGNKYLADNGEYKEIPKIELDTVMSNTSENPVQNKVMKKYVDDNITEVDIEMDDESENPVQNRIVKEYIDTLQEKVEELTAIKETEDVNNVNALSRSSDGLFVKDLTPTVNRINYAQKTCRDDKREWIHYSDNVNTVDIAIGATVLSLLNKCDSIETSLDESRYNDNYVMLKAGISYNINVNFVLKYSNINDSNIILIKIVSDTGRAIVDLISERWTNGNYHTTYTPTEDIFVGFSVRNPTSSSEIINRTLDIYIEAIEPTVIDPVEYVDHRDGLQDNPVGTIIAYMGTIAPEHYLLCDGSEYQITDYPYLAQHIKDNFGTESYWGGDGVETFATPDLRAEFLRGAGEATRQTGAGANVGQHQDPTTISTEGYGGLKFTTGSNPTPTTVQTVTSYSAGSVVEDNNAPRDAVLTTNNATSTTNVDTGITTYSDTMNMSTTVSEPIVATKDDQLSMRPTATSVNFCIKAEPTYYLVVTPGNSN